jgi:opacity protein-like surface antigen
MTQQRMPGHQQPTLAAPETRNNEVYQGVVSNGCNDCGQSCGGSQCGGSQCGTSRCGSDFGMQSGCPMFYFSIFGGTSVLGEMGNDQGDTLFTDDGGAFGLAIGQRHGRNLRSELEFSYRTNNLEQVELASGQIRPMNGDLTSYSGMANVYWEFTQFPHTCLKPYIGAGLGFTSIDSSMTNLAGANLIPAGGGNDSSFAYQFLAGVNYKAYRNMDLFLEYRLFKSDSLRIETVPNWGAGDYDYQSEGLFAGLRWKF